MSQGPGSVGPVDDSGPAAARHGGLCPACGHECELGARFCSQCGTALDGVKESLGYAGWASSGGEVAPAAPAATPAASAVPATDATGLIAPVGTPAEPAELPVVDESTSKELAPGAGMLLVRRGVFEGTSFVLDGPVGTVVSVGRAPDSTLFLDDVTVSRRHAEFRREEQGWTVHDVGSLNGTYVERRRTDEDEHLGGGEEIQIGKYRFVFLAAAVDRVAVTPADSEAANQKMAGEGQR